MDSAQRAQKVMGGTDLRTWARITRAAHGCNTALPGPEPLPKGLPGRVSLVADKLAGGGPFHLGKTMAWCVCVCACLWLCVCGWVCLCFLPSVHGCQVCECVRVRVTCVSVYLTSMCIGVVCVSPNTRGCVCMHVPGCVCSCVWVHTYACMFLRVCE